jgi:hypothetical protein
MSSSKFSKHVDLESAVSLVVKDVATIKKDVGQLKATVEVAVTLLKAITLKFDDRSSVQEVTHVVPAKKTGLLTHAEVTNKLNDFEKVIEDLIKHHSVIKDIS